MPGNEKEPGSDDDPVESWLRSAARAPIADLNLARGASLTPGATLLSNRFRIVRRLGAGGMGVVYEADDAVRRSRVAIKMLASLDAGGIYRLKNEFRALSDVVHPGLVRLHELFCDGAQWFFSMDLIGGVPFDRWVRPHDAFDEARVRASIAQCARAVQAVHAAGKLHRDLKPSNVLVTPAGRVVVLDFGLSSDPEVGGQGQTTHDGSVSGTPAYMAPEQAAGRRATEASDFYAIGVMLFEALTGRWPFEGTTGAVIAAKQRDVAPKASSLGRDVPEDLESLCAQLLARDPSERPNAQAICALLGQSEADALPDSSASASTSTSTNTDRPKEAPLVGRDSQLAQLQDAYARSLAGALQVVVVSGESGIGKSALLDAFLSGLRSQSSAMACVLSARCNERESLPFKAFDAVVDGLSRRMRRLGREAAALLPRDVFALAKVFPVLDRIDVIAEAPRRDLSSAEALRSHAFDAFGELLGRVRDREPVVIAIDDAQWVDRDSVALLRAVLGQTEPPPLLLVLSHRDESTPASSTPAGSTPAGSTIASAQDDPALAASPLHDLLEVVLGDPRLHVESLALPPLSFDASQALALRLLGDGDPDGTRQLDRAKSVASEAQGSPFFIGELSSRLRSPHAAVPTMTQAIAEHVAELPQSACALLEVLAVAGRPLAAEIALEAAGADHDSLDLLRDERLARASESGSVRSLECYHDRIRESVSSTLSAEQLRDTHSRLAQVLVKQREPDLEHLATHFEGAQDHARAAQYAAGAAERAADKLAFDRAAYLYGRALELGRYDSDRTRELTLARGRALALCGHTHEAAEIYLDALPGASEHEAPRLRGRAAEQLMLSAQVERVVEQLDLLLAGQNLPALNLARSPIPALLVRRAALRVRGLRYELRPDESIDPATLRLLDVYWACVMGLAQIDLIRSAEFSSRHLWLALSSGSATHIGRALAYESGIAGGTGSKQNYARAAAVLAQAAALAERTEDPYLQACVAQWSGVNALNAARYADAVADSDRALSLFRERCPDAPYEIMITEMFLLWALWGLGECARLSAWLRTHIEREAAGHGRDLPTVMKTFFALIWLVRDDVLVAKRIAAEGTPPDADGRTGARPYTFPDFMRWCVECMIDWYGEDCEAAWRKCDVSWLRMRSAPIMRNISTRISVLYCRAGSALLALRVTRPGSMKHSALLRAATAAQRELAEGNNPVGHAWAHVIEAGLGCARGDRDVAIEKMHAALATFEAQGASMYAAAARRRLGVLIGGEQGVALVEGADRAMTKQGIVRPDRITAMLIPACEIVRASASNWRIE